MCEFVPVVAYPYDRSAMLLEKRDLFSAIMNLCQYIPNSFVVHSVKYFEELSEKYGDNIPLNEIMPYGETKSITTKCKGIYIPAFCINHDKMYVSNNHNGSKYEPSNIKYFIDEEPLVLYPNAYIMTQECVIVWLNTPHPKGKRLTIDEVEVIVKNNRNKIRFSSNGKPSRNGITLPNWQNYLKCTYPKANQQPYAFKHEDVVFTKSSILNFKNLLDINKFPIHYRKARDKLKNSYLEVYKQRFGLTEYDLWVFGYRNHLYDDTHFFPMHGKPIVGFIDLYNPDVHLESIGVYLEQYLNDEYFILSKLHLVHKNPLYADILDFRFSSDAITELNLDDYIYICENGTLTYENHCIDDFDKVDESPWGFLNEPYKPVKQDCRINSILHNRIISTMGSGEVAKLLNYPMNKSSTESLLRSIDGSFNGNDIFKLNVKENFEHLLMEYINMFPTNSKLSNCGKIITKNSFEGDPNNIIIVDKLGISLTLIKEKYQFDDMEGFIIIPYGMNIYNIYYQLKIRQKMIRSLTLEEISNIPMTILNGHDILLVDEYINLIHRYKDFEKDTIKYYPEYFLDDSMSSNTHIELDETLNYLQIQTVILKTK